MVPPLHCAWRMRSALISLLIALNLAGTAAPVLAQSGPRNCTVTSENAYVRAVLDRLAGPHLKRPVGRPPKEGYEDVIELGFYQARSWRHPQRVLLVIIDTPDPKTGQLNLLPD